MSCVLAIPGGLAAAVWIGLVAGGQAAAQTAGYLQFVVVPGLLGHNAGEESRAPLYDLSAGGRVSRLLDSGFEIGGEILLRAQRNTRDGFSDTVAQCPPERDQCPFLIGADGRRRAPVSQVTGFTTTALPRPPDVRIGIDTGIFSVRSGWGEVSFGRDVGVAVRLDARAPSILSASGPTLGVLDPLGLAFARARNDPSGVALKASFLTPRLLGFRAGVSVTPGDADAGVSGPRGVDLTGLLEAAVSFSHVFERSLSVRSAVTYSVGSPCCDVVHGQYHALGLGLEIEQDRWRYGGRYLLSNNARSWNGQAYQAIELGITRRLQDWEIGLEASAAGDDLLATSGYLVAAVASRGIDRIRLAVAIMHGQRSFPHSETGRAQRSHTGALGEISVRIERHQ